MAKAAEIVDKVADERDMTRHYLLELLRWRTVAIIQMVC